VEYRPSEIEPKWRQWWTENSTYRVENQAIKPKYYILDMFPYPSGAGLHVGHPLGYIASDILAGTSACRGFNVLHPMGLRFFRIARRAVRHPNGATSSHYYGAESSPVTGSNSENIGFLSIGSREVQTSNPRITSGRSGFLSNLFNHYYDLEADKALRVSDL
jgi:leucyl-tRNA synthetase